VNIHAEATQQNTETSRHYEPLARMDL